MLDTFAITKEMVRQMRKLSVAEAVEFSCSRKAAQELKEKSMKAVAILKA